MGSPSDAPTPLQHAAHSSDMQQGTPGATAATHPDSAATQPDSAATHPDSAARQGTAQSDSRAGQPNAAPPGIQGIEAFVPLPSWLRDVQGEEG